MNELALAGAGSTALGLGAVVTWLQWSDDPLGTVHLLAAYVALLSGAGLFLRKKGDSGHRLLGYGYLLAMLTVNGTALSLYQLSGGVNLFHFVAVCSLATLIPALLVLLRQRGQARHRLAPHAVLMAWSYFGLVLAAICEFVTRQWPVLLHGNQGWLRFSLFLGVLMASGGFVMGRILRRTLPRYFPQ